VYEKERYKDRFFSTFREERPNLTPVCRIRLELSKCPKLLIWIPLKVFIKEILGYGHRKYPDFLTFSSLKERRVRIIQRISAKPKTTKE
jgi:hypothetical protein